MTDAVLTGDQQARERSIVLAIVLDIAIVVAMVTVSVAGGSFTLLAESIRAALGLVPEWFTYGVLRRMHRGTLRGFDYGTHKLEQIVSVTIELSMLFAGVWIVLGALRVLAGERDLATPFGLACAATVGMVNVYINLVAWDGLRRVVRSDDSPMMRAQLKVRRTKFLASAIITADLTVAALSTDPVVVAFADAFGALFVAAYLLAVALQGLRTVLPDLLELSASKATRLAVVRALARHAGDYTDLQNVRTRRSSQSAFVEIALVFDENLSMAEVHRRIEALKATVREEVGDVDVTILASAPSRSGNLSAEKIPT